MQLMTEEIARRMPAFGSTDGMVVSRTPIAVKYFNPTGAGTWYAFEGELQEDGDWLFFGLVAGLGENELGYFVLSELAGYRGLAGLGIERDYHPPAFVPDGELKDWMRDTSVLEISDAGGSDSAPEDGAGSTISERARS